MKKQSWFDCDISNRLFFPSHENKKLRPSVGFGSNEHNKHSCVKFVSASKSNFNLHITKNINSDSSYLKNDIKTLNSRLESEKDKKTVSSIKSKITKTQKLLDNTNKVTICRKFTFYPSKTQKDILNTWFLESRRVYNYCVQTYNDDNAFFDNGYMKAKLRIFDSLYGDDDKPVPYDILTDEIRKFCSNLKSCLSNLKNGNIKHFKMKYITNNNMYNIFIPKTAVKQKGFYLSHLGKIEDFNIKDVECDCRISYDRIFKKYTFYYPKHINKTLDDDKIDVVALDPGEKKFMSFYSTSDYGHIGKDMRKKILIYEGKIRRWQRILSRRENRNGTEINKNNVKKKIRKNYEKIRNYVKELHNKTALYLCNHYHRIIIPPFETQKMVRKKREKPKEDLRSKIREITKKKRLNRRVKFVLNMLSHYKFRQHLRNKCNEYGCEMIEITEEYTSQTCTKCGEISNTYEKRIKKCEKCEYEIDRDVNGSRNILIKYIKKAEKS